MRKSVFLLLLLCQASRVIAQDTAMITPGGLIADLDVLATTIRENHPMLGAYISPDSFDRMCQDIVMDIDDGITRQAFHSSLSHLLQSIGCGHTFAFATSESVERLKWMNDLPFEIVVVDTSVYVKRAWHPDYVHYRGARLVSINDQPMGGLLHDAFDHISSDGHNTTYKAYSFQRLFNYYLNLILSNPDSLNIKTSVGEFLIRYPTHFIREEPEDGETRFSELTGAPNTVLLSVPGFDSGKSKIRKCFKYMAAHQTEHLVVDLRNNGGGNGIIGTSLVSYIIDTTLIYFLDKKTNPMQYKKYLKRKEGLVLGGAYFMTDSTTRSYFFKVKSKRKYNFDGQVYVITNGGTFSTGSFVASALKHKAGAICVGQETGGSAFGIGGGVIGRLILPYTQISVRFPLYRWRFNVTKEDTGRGVMPDLPIDYIPVSIYSEVDLDIIAIREKILQGLRNAE